ncbi:MAG: TonB-dependent receptor plug domain-containing protein [Akkermansiaceae bacterium]|nr:TonB-dependent receptor plug domain-containing protein [Akkermansiaceae bacterium]
MIKKSALSESSCHVVLALALASSCAAVAPSPTTPLPAAEDTELAPVTVSAHEGAAVPYDQTGVSVSVLDVEELKKEGIFSLSEALTTVPGAYVLPGGGKYQRGNVSDLVIRGMSSQRLVMPMIDGMRLGGGLSSGDGLIVNNFVARAPLFGMGTLELVRGAQGAVYGSGAMAGVLFMETPEGKGEPSVSLFNEYGSFDSYTGNVTAQGRVDDTAFFVSSSYERTNNNPHFADGSTPDLKHAAKHEMWAEALRLDQFINSRHQLTFTYRREDSSYRNYSPGYESFGWVSPSAITRYSFRTQLTTLKLQSHLSERYSTSLLAGYFGSDSDLGLGYVQSLRNVQLEWRHAFQWNDAHKTTGGVAWARTDFDTVNSGVKMSSNSSLDSVLSLFAEHSVEPVNGWTSSLAARLDESLVYDALFTLRAATNYKFNRERTRVFSSVGRGYAAPSSFQRSTAAFNNGYATYYGNPRLACETNWSIDAGAEQEIARDHFLSATLFWLRTEDAITALPSADYSRYDYTNAAGHWTNQGIELALRGTFAGSGDTGYKLAYTLTQPKTNGGRQIPGSARQVWAADVHTSPISRLTTGVGLSAAVGRRGYAGRGLDNYLVLRWYAHYEVNEHLSLHLRVENLTNQKFMLDEDWTGNASGTWVNPGTAVYAGCTIKF